MYCIYCNKKVYGANGMTVPGQGAAHRQCFQAHQALKRTFQNLDISQLTDQELIELKDLILSEENSRNREKQGQVSDVELF